MEHLGVLGFTGAGANRLFSALTGLPVPSEYEPAIGVATVPDERLDRLTAMSQSRKRVPATFELVHLALPAGAKPTEGLGARLLGELRNCDAICVVLRSGGPDGMAPDVAGDLEALRLELVLADAATVEGRLERQRRAAKGDKTLAGEIAALERALEILAAGTPIAESDLDAARRELLAPCFLLTVKPLLVVLNTGDDVAPDSDLVRRVGTFTNPTGSPASQRREGGEGGDGGDDGDGGEGGGGGEEEAGALAVPVDLEAEIAACEPDDRAEMREMYGLTEPALDRVAHAAYHRLGLRTFFTTGDKESRAWTFRAGARAPECAGVIHSDLQRGFIRAEVIGWEELLEIGSWSRARELGRLRVEGKDYEVADGDVLEIRFNV